MTETGDALKVVAILQASVRGYNDARVARNKREAAAHLVNLRADLKPICKGLDTWNSEWERKGGDGLEWSLRNEPTMMEWADLDDVKDLLVDAMDRRQMWARLNRADAEIDRRAELIARLEANREGVPLRGPEYAEEIHG